MFVNFASNGIYFSRYHNLYSECTQLPVVEFDGCIQICCLQCSQLARLCENIYKPSNPNASDSPRCLNSRLSLWSLEPLLTYFCPVGEFCFEILTYLTASY